MGDSQNILDPTEALDRQMPTNRIQAIMSTLPRIAIVGAGPMSIYTIKGLLKSETALDLTIFDMADLAGCGMPYRSGMNADYMYCNAFSKEIPPITRRLVTWLHDQDDNFLHDWDLEQDDIDARDFYPRVLIGEFLKSELKDICSAGRDAGHKISVLTRHEVVDVLPVEGAFTLEINSAAGKSRRRFDNVVLATGHDWPKSPKIDKADLVSPWPYTNITDLPPGKIGILGSSLSAIDVIVALGQEHGTFKEDGDKLDWFPNKGREALSTTMVSHKGIMPEPDFYYPYPYEPLVHVHADAVSEEVAKGSSKLLARVFALLLSELNQVSPEYMAELGADAQTIEGFSEAYFAHRERLGGLRALRETLNISIQSKKNKETQHHRYALLRGHENFELILEHLDDGDWATFNDELMPVFGDCYAAIPHISVRRVLALYDAGVLQIIPTGPEGSFRNNRKGGVSVTTIDGDVAFDAVVDARGQAPAPLRDLPFPTLISGLVDPDADLLEPFKLNLRGKSQGDVYCLAMPQILARHPFSQGLPNCDNLGRGVAQQILSGFGARRK